MLFPRKIRFGMIGGGIDAFIGAIHRIAAAMDQNMELVCGAFSSTSEKSKRSGEALRLPPDRCYGTFEDMIKAEAQLPPDQRMEFVVIVTPNHMHFAPAMLALEYGFHVLSDKPATFSLKEAKLLEAAVKQYGRLYGLTHNYTGYPMIKQARELVQSGKLGKIRKVIAGYPQGWLHTRLEATGQKQSWRTGSKQSGEAGAVGDIGSHAENLLEYVTGLHIIDVAADLTTFVEGRELDDDASMLLRLTDGARGILHCSQISIGHENDPYVQVYGSLGSLQWSQTDPNSLLVSWPDKPMETWRTRGGSYLCTASTNATRTPSGHPEGYLEAFANLYHQFGLHILAAEGGNLEGDAFDYPRITEAVRGMAFIRAAVTSSKANAAWVNIPALLAA